MLLDPLIEINRALYRMNLQIMVFLCRWGMKSLAAHFYKIKKDQEIFNKVMIQKQAILRLEKFKVKGVKEEKFEVKILE